MIKLNTYWVVMVPSYSGLVPPTFYRKTRVRVPLGSKGDQTKDLVQIFIRGWCYITPSSFFYYVKQIFNLVKEGE